MRCWPNRGRGTSRGGRKAAAAGRGAVRLAQSRDRIAKERAMRRRRFKRLWARLKQLSAMTLTREALLMKLGAARQQAPSAWRLVEVDLVGTTLRYRLRRDKLREVRRCEGRYLLRTNLTETDPARLWQFYLQLVAVEEAFKTSREISPSVQSSIKRYPHRSAHLHRLPCLLPARHAESTAACPGTGTDPTQCAREVRRRADARCAHPDHRWSRTLSSPATPSPSPI